MQIRVSPKNGVPIYLQIIRQVTYLAASGRLEPGEKLPPVRKLAEKLLVHPNTVARAYSELESQDILRIRRARLESPPPTAYRSGAEPCTALE